MWHKPHLLTAIADLLFLAGAAALLMSAVPALAGGVSPIVGAAAPYTGNATFYASSFGRDLFNVFQASVINSAFGNDPIKEMFKGSSSKVCSAVDTIEDFGFLVLATCGDSTSNLRGA